MNLRICSSACLFGILLASGACGGKGPGSAGTQEGHRKGAPSRTVKAVVVSKTFFGKGVRSVPAVCVRAMTDGVEDHYLRIRILGLEKDGKRTPVAESWCLFSSGEIRKGTHSMDIYIPLARTPNLPLRAVVEFCRTFDEVLYSRTIDLEDAKKGR